MHKYWEQSFFWLNKFSTNASLLIEEMQNETKHNATKIFQS